MVKAVWNHQYIYLSQLVYWIIYSYKLLPKIKVFKLCTDNHLLEKNSGFQIQSEQIYWPEVWYAESARVIRRNNLTVGKKESVFSHDWKTSAHISLSIILNWSKLKPACHKPHLQSKLSGNEFNYQPSINLLFRVILLKIFVVFPALNWPFQYLILKLSKKTSYSFNTPLQEAVFSYSSLFSSCITSEQYDAIPSKSFKLP